MSRPGLKMPSDKQSAKEVMKKFSDMAYSLSHLIIFEEAIHILYGREFDISLDLSKRMQFSCKICNREMNSENAMAEHYRSGAHQKNLDKRNRESGELSFVPRARDYARDSIQFMLLNSHISPVGLQMVEEYINKRGNTYYKCILCGAHGKMDIMYHHIVNKKHTEKYIKSACVLENSILTPNEREEIRKKLLNKEGVIVDKIKTIRGNELYPTKWEREGITAKNYNLKIKKERRSSSSSPPPDRYRDRSRSSSSSMSQESHRYKRSRSRSHGRRSRSITPKWRRYSRSPSSRRSRTPPWRTSQSPSTRRSKSPGISSKYSRKSHKSPSRSRRGHSSHRSPELSRKHYSLGGTSSSEGKSPKRIKREKVHVERSPSPRPSRSQATGIEKQLDSFRNRSPPPVSIKSEPLSPLKNAHAATSSLHIKTEHGTVPGGTGFNETDLPLSLASVKKESVDTCTQTKLDLDPLMKRLTGYVKGCKAHPLKTAQDVKDSIELMSTIAHSLRELAITQLQDESFKSPERKQFLFVQKEKREKIIGYSTKWYLPTWEKEIKGKY